MTDNMKPEIIAACSLGTMRDLAKLIHTEYFAGWLVGRADCAATMAPSVETLSAANECAFLRTYHNRHGVGGK